MGLRSVEPDGESRGGSPLQVRDFLFLLGSARDGGNAEILARHAAAALPTTVRQQWVRFSDLSLPPFEDIREEDGRAPACPAGDARALLQATLAATDLVFVAPLYWYALPASLKQYLDHWSGWMHLPELRFRQRMSGKAMWAVTVSADEDPALAEPALEGLRLSASYLRMTWRGALLGRGSRRGDVLADADALERARRFFRDEPLTPPRG